MGFLASTLARKAEPALQAFLDVYGSLLSGSGKTVNWKTALQVSTAFACARVIADGIAQVPLKLMQQSGDKRRPAVDHPLYDLLNRRPSEFQTSYELRESLAFHVVFTGRAYVFKVIVLGVPRELILLDPARMATKRLSGGQVQYTYQFEDGTQRIIPSELIWHIRGPSWNTWEGLDCVQIAREALGLALAIEESQAKFHQNGAQNSGILSVEGSLNELQHQQLTSWLKKEVVGSANAGNVTVVDRAAKFVNRTMSGIDAQLLDTRKFQIEEICRAFRVMPIMVGYSDKATTYASAEQMFLAHVVHTLAPWYQRLEQSIDANLLTDKDRKSGIYANFTEEGLLRGSLKDTKDMILGYVNGGILTPNEGRALLDRNPDADPESDKLRIPANIVGEPPAEPSAKPGE